LCEADEIGVPCSIKRFLFLNSSCSLLLPQVVQTTTEALYITKNYGKLSGVSSATAQTCAVAWR